MRKREKTGGDSQPWVWIAALRAVVLALLVGVMIFFTPTAQAQVSGATSDQVRTVIPVGRAVGIKLFSKGVLVVGLSDVETESGTVSPARTCGLRSGDIITNINSQEVNTIDQVSDLLQQLEGEEMSLRVSRGGKTLQLSGEAVQCVSDGSYRLGAWIRDSMAGIGTVTFFDPQTNTFAALGHGISDTDTGALMPISFGGIMSAQVSDVVQGSAGVPGELHGTFDLETELGTLTANTERGIFGTVSEEVWTGTAVPVASRREVQVGKATILANVSGDTVEEFEVEILRLYPAAISETRNLMIQITDERLLERTGGVVQGMSGSPILQGGKLVGAVTHVLLDDPTRGYGILAENMLEMMA